MSKRLQKWRRCATCRFKCSKYLVHAGRFWLRRCGHSVGYVEQSSLGESYGYPAVGLLWVYGDLLWRCDAVCNKDIKSITNRAKDTCIIVAGQRLSRARPWRLCVTSYHEDINDINVKIVISWKLKKRHYARQCSSSNTHPFIWYLREKVNVDAFFIIFFVLLTHEQHWFQGRSESWSLFYHYFLCHHSTNSLRFQEGSENGKTFSVSLFSLSRSSNNALRFERRTRLMNSRSSGF